MFKTLCRQGFFRAKFNKLKSIVYCCKYLKVMYKVVVEFSILNRVEFYLSEKKKN